MKGHVRKRGKESWAIVLDLGRDADGKRRQKWHSVKGTKRDAEREMARLVNSLNVGDYIEPSKIRVSEFLAKWLEDYAKANVSPKTYERYEQIIDSSIVPKLGAHRLADLRPMHIQGFYSEAMRDGRRDGKGGLSAQTVLHFHRLLHKTLAQAVKWQLLARNPADAVDPPKPEKKSMRALDEGETAELLRYVEGSLLYMPVLLAVTTGLRRGEILALRWQDIDMDRAQATIVRSLEQTKEGLRFKRPKTERSSRNVALPSFVVEALKRYRVEQATHRLKLGLVYEDQDLICARDNGAAIPPDTLSTNFASTIRRSTMSHVRFHDLRHTHATQLLKHGVHPKVVSERLGHSKIGITLDTYSHVMPGMQEDAALKMDAVLRKSMLDGG